MELELCLALPTPFSIKAFDLNGHRDLESEESLLNNSFDDNFLEMKNDIMSMKKKRNFTKAFEDSNKIQYKTLSLLLWNDHGNKRRAVEACDKNFEEENQILGLPSLIVGGRNSMYVKVKMEGVAIGRKVDLRLYNSYHVLANNLVQMFENLDQNCNDNGARFMLLYQDREGDWMLAGDVPWKTFMETVHRIEILKEWEVRTKIKTII